MAFIVRQQAPPLRRPFLKRSHESHFWTSCNTHDIRTRFLFPLWQDDIITRVSAAGQLDDEPFETVSRGVSFAAHCARAGQVSNAGVGW